MVHEKILKSLNEANSSKFVARKWNVVNDNSKSNCGAENETVWNTEVLTSYLCDQNDAYILVRGDISIACRNLATEEAFEISAPFTKCITNID